MYWDSLFCDADAYTDFACLETLCQGFPRPQSLGRSSCRVEDTASSVRHHRWKPGKPNFQCPDHLPIACSKGLHRIPRHSIASIDSITQIQTSDNERQELQPNPADYNAAVSSYYEASPSTVSQAIEKALAAKPAWEAMPFADKAAIFLKAADLISGKYRFKIMAATILGQGKNAWQAEIDAAAELCDFLR